MTATVHAIEPYLTQREYEEQLEKAELAAGWFFKRCSQPQQAEYDTAMAANRFLSGPAWQRKREAAKKRFAETTKEARELYERTVSSFMETGECSPNLDDEWTALLTRASDAINEAAE